MARMAADKLYNGSAAYDLYRVEGTAAPKIDHPSLPEEISRPERHSHAKVKHHLSAFAVFGVMVTACMLILVIFGYVQLYEASQRVSDLKSELSELRQEQIVLESVYDSSIDLDYVEMQAEALGYGVPDRDQIQYLNLVGEDKAEIYTVKKQNIFQRVIGAIESSATGLVEYLS